MAETTIDERQAAKWAQEETLRRLLREAAVSNQILEKFVESNLSKDELEALKENVEATKDLGSSTTTSLKTLGDRYDRSLKDAYRDLDRSLSNSFRDFAGSMRDLSRNGILGVLQESSDKASKNLFSMGQNLTGFGSKLSYAGAGLATFAALVIEGWNIVSDLNDNYLKLYENGINFSQGLRGMTQATGDLGVTTEELIGIFTQHGAAVATLGTDRAVRLGKEFVKLNRGMGELGLTNAQATEAVLEYTELIRSTGQLSKMSNRDLIEGTREYYGELNQITALTGQNRREIQKSIEARAKELGYQALLRSLPEDVQKNITKSMISLEKLGPAGAQAAQKTVVAMLARGGISGLSGELQKVLVTTGLYDTFETLSQKAAAGADITDEMDEIASRLGDPEIFKNFQAFADMPGAMGDFVRTLAELSMSTQNINDQNKRLMSAATEEYNKLSRAEQQKTSVDIIYNKLKQKEIEDTAARNARETEVQNTLNQASQQLTSIFNTLVVDVLNPMLPALKLFGDIVIGLSEKFKSFSEWLGETLRSWAPTFGIGIGEPEVKNEKGEIVQERESDWTDVAGGLGAATVGLGAAGAALGGTVYAKRRLFGGGRRRGRERTEGEEAPGSETLSGIESMMETMSTTGPAIGPGLTGAATGLRAFANPQILIGAGILAGSITAIGAGIAGATWIMGKALPSLADGLRSFTDIDGTRLGEVGMGMIKIGGGLVAMGVGEVASAWGSIASGITSLFQADPISKLMRFAEISGPLSEAADSMEKFGTAYPNAIRMLNEVELGPAAHDAMDQIKSLLGSDMGTFFGGQPPIIGQISDLASSIGKLSQSAAQLTSGANQLQMGPQRLEGATVDITDKTLDFYDNSKSSYQSMVTLLQTVNVKLDALNKTTQDQTDELTRTISRGGNSVF